MPKPLQFSPQGRFFGIIGNVDERGRIGDDPSVGGQVRQVAERLHRFEGDNQVAAAFRDQVAADRFGGKAEVALHIPSALAHPMDLGLFKIKVLVQGGPSDHGGDGQDALSSHAG